MTPPTLTETEAKLEVLTEAVLFLIRHVPVPHLTDAFIADLHRFAAGDAGKRTVVDDLAYRLRARDEFIAEDDA